MKTRMPDPQERSEFAEKCKVELDNPDYHLYQLSFEPWKFCLCRYTVVGRKPPVELDFGLGKTK
jgi:hypothetical protein